MTVQAGAVEIEGVVKSFGAVRALDGVSFTAQPGRVTGLLGPNGSGKTTTLRILLGLVAADAGRATIGGTAYVDLAEPARTAGAALEARFHPARTAQGHLRIQALAAGIDVARVPAVLELVGLVAAADRRIGGFSLGMRQRLALATALLGDPGVILLDEPINGLDPEGIRWIRLLLRHLAGEGRTVLLSSHLLGEVAQTVDDVVVVSRGTIVYQGGLQGLEGPPRVRVDAEPLEPLAAALRAAGAGDVAPVAGGAGLEVTGLDAAAVGEAALAARIPLRHLAAAADGLEQAFFDLVATAEEAQ